MSFFSRITAAIARIFDGTSTVSMVGSDTLRFRSPDNSILISVEDIGVERRINLSTAGGAGIANAYSKISNELAQQVNAIGADELRIVSTNNSILRTLTEGIPDILDLKVDSNVVQFKSEKGIAGGYCGLDLDGFVPAANIPPDINAASVDGFSVTGLQGQVAFFDVGVVKGDNALFWDNSNKRLGIKTIAGPGFDLDVNGIINGASIRTGGIERISSTGALLNVSANVSILTSGVLGIARGGTGLASLGLSNQLLSVNSGGTGLEYRTLSSSDNSLIFNFGLNSIDARARLASATLYGMCRLSVAPASALDPVAVGDNDVRLIRPSGIIIKYKTSDESVINSDVLQDDDHLFFNIGANEVWQIEGYLDVFSTDNAVNLRMAWQAPVGATINIAWHSISLSSDQSDIMKVIGGYSMVLVKGDALTPVFYKGVVINGATSGVFKLQWAQGSQSLSSMTIRAGSYLKATRII